MDQDTLRFPYASEVHQTILAVTKARAHEMRGICRRAKTHIICTRVQLPILRARETCGTYNGLSISEDGRFLSLVLY